MAWDNPRLHYSSGDGLHPSARGTAVAAAGLKGLVEELESGTLDVKEAPLGESESSLVGVARSLGAAEPDYSRVFHRQGVEFLKKGRFEEAVAQFKRALDEDPKHAGAHGNMGLAYERLGKPADAKRHYLIAIEIRDDFVQAHFNLARLTLTEGDTAVGSSIVAPSDRDCPQSHGRAEPTGNGAGESGGIRRGASSFGACREHRSRFFRSAQQLGHGVRRDR